MSNNCEISYSDFVDMDNDGCDNDWISVEIIQSSHDAVNFMSDGVNSGSNHDQIFMNGFMKESSVESVSEECDRLKVDDSNLLSDEEFMACIQKYQQISVDFKSVVMDENVDVSSSSGSSDITSIGRGLINENVGEFGRVEADPEWESPGDCFLTVSNVISDDEMESQQQEQILSVALNDDQFKDELSSSSSRSLRHLSDVFEEAIDNVVNEEDMYGRVDVAIQIESLVVHMPTEAHPMTNATSSTVCDTAAVDATSTVSCNTTTSDCSAEVRQVAIDDSSSDPVAATAAAASSETNGGGPCVVVDAAVLSSRPLNERPKPQQQQQSMISFLDFQSNDIALFLPMDAKSRDVWSAFNSMKQHYYLSEQSMSVFLPRGACRDQRVFVLGRIVMLDAYRASAQFNPFRLSVGTEFHICHVEPLSHQQQRNSKSGLVCSDTSSSLLAPDDERVKHDRIIPRISFAKFDSGDLALFLLGNKQRNIWMAFHSNKPYYFLSDESLSVFMNLKRDQQRVFILGRIVYIDTFTASVESNPYSLQHGTQYHICYVEPVSSAKLLERG